MNEQFSSKAHDICLKQLQNRKNDIITKCIDAINEKHIAFTCKLFNTVYSLAKRSRPFSDIEDAIDLWLKNGVDLGVGLHSRHTAAKIVDHVANDIKNDIFTKLLNSIEKFALSLMKLPAYLISLFL